MAPDLAHEGECGNWVYPAFFRYAAAIWFDSAENYRPMNMLERALGEIREMQDKNIFRAACPVRVKEHPSNKCLDVAHSGRAGQSAAVERNDHDYCCRTQS